MTATAMLTLPSCDSDGGAGDVSSTGTGEGIPETITITPKETVALDEAYTLLQHNSYAGAKEGIQSAWRLDNRGGIPRTDIEGAYGNLTDISETAPTAMIREFNRVSSGVLTLETGASVAGSYDGFSLEFHNEADSVVYKIVTRNGGWAILSPDGTEAALNVENAKTYEFRIIIDLDNGTSETFINNVACGVHPLLTTGADCNLYNFRFATDDASTAVATLGKIRMTANYAVNADFGYYALGEAPHDFVCEGAEIDNALLEIKEGYAEKTFTPIDGTVIAETEWILPRRQSASFALCADGHALVTFSSDKNNFYANGQLLYENYVQNLWYTIRLEAHTDTDTAVIWMNGRKIGEVPFAAETDYFDGVRAANSEKSKMQFDNIRVFRKITHDDYVPAPVVPKGQENYTVGMNICSLWREGTHTGWSCITPYDDAEPVLGYYDEGCPETADWEIKYMVEHGIDFQAFCWYANTNNEVVHPWHLQEQLHDGYKYAEYSDYMKYCLIWEASNAGSPDSFSVFQKNFAPYFIEHYFKDSRYMTIDNRLVLCVFGADKMAERIGGEAGVKQCFDYLEEEVKKLGFDGMIYLVCGQSADRYAAMGFDGSYAYNWGNAGSEISVNKTSILNSATNQSMYTVPTVSVGFNSIPWHGVRYPMMTPADYETTHLWVRDEYLPQYAEKDSWQENFVMLSTWNEYGEGTYIMPSKGNGGFGYLDALRKVYTSEAVDESLNLIPTAAQRERINHLFPQYRQLLRKQGYASMDVDPSTLDVLDTISFTSKKNKYTGSMGNVKYAENGMTGYVNGDALVVSEKLKVDTNEVQYLRVTLDVPQGTSCEVFFITDRDAGWAQNKGTGFAAKEEGLASYLLDMSKIATWKNTVTAIRIDPGQCAQDAGDPEQNYFRIVSIECMGKSGGDPKVLYINEKEVTMQLYPETVNDIHLIAFDPKIALDHRLNVFYTWDKATGTLTLAGTDHTVVYTVGRDTYTLDGAEKPLGYTMYQNDGLPMISPKQLCEDLGYTYSVDDNGIISIVTPQMVHYDNASARLPGRWEFDTNGDSEGWSSSAMTLSVLGGTMTATTTVQTGDPIISYNNEVNLPADDYVAVEIRCRYNYDADYAHTMCIYFTTDTDGNMSESMRIHLPLDSTDSGEEWMTYRVSLTDNPTWNGTIKNIRFDPFNCMGTMEVDYIRFLKEGE